MKVWFATVALAFLFSLPVVYHRLWSLGFQSGSTRVLLHSIFGCLVYGAFAAKVLIVRTPRWVLFVSNCGSCHTLAAAGTKGQVGPKLDGLKLGALTVTSFMKAGPGSMPSFSGMPAAQRDAIVTFVVASSR